MVGSHLISRIHIRCKKKKHREIANPKKSSTRRCAPNKNTGNNSAVERINSSLISMCWWAWWGRWQSIWGATAARVWSSIRITILSRVTVTSAVAIAVGPWITIGIGVVQWSICCCIKCRSPIFTWTACSWAAFCKLV